MFKRVRFNGNGLKTTAALIALCAVSFSSVPATAQNWCAGKITHKDSLVVPRLKKPRALQTFKDPAFGTQITRITNAPKGTARRTLYSTIQPWNADESLLMLYHTGDVNAGHHLYNGKTYEHIRAMEFQAADIEEVYWDETNSSLLYFIQRRPSNDPLYGKLVRYNVQTRKRSLVADLDPICGNAAKRGGVTVRGGNDIQGIANHKIGLRCVNDRVRGESSDITFHVNVRTGKISPQVRIDPAKPQGSNTFGFRPDVAATPMHSGKRVVIQDSVFDTNMNFLYPLDGSVQNYKARNGRTYKVPKTEHSTSGRMPNGHDAIFSPRFDAPENGCDGDSERGQGALVAHNVNSGSCNVMVGMSNGWGYPLSGIHLSSASKKNPGWVTMTTQGSRRLDYLKNGRRAPVMFSELSLTYADPDNPVTCRLAHLRTMGASARNAASYRGGYFGEPHAVMSPSGSRILFNSDWYDSGSVDTYAVNLRAQNSNLTAEQTPAWQPAFHLKAQVRMNDTPQRVYIDYVNPNHSRQDRIAIARAGTSDRRYVMWLYTNGTQTIGKNAPIIGRLDFLRKYIGRGKFEARLFVDGNLDKAVKRVSFTIP